MDTPTLGDDVTVAGQVLDVDEVYRHARVLDPTCTIEAVAEYVREINDMAGVLYDIALAGQSETTASLSSKQQSNGQ